MVCKEGGDGKRCRKEGVLYEIQCDQCDDVYTGETGNNAYTRGTQHEEALDRDENSVLHIHSNTKHADSPNPPKYIMKVTNVFGGDATKRQIAEAIKIENTPTHRLMNRKEEFTRCKLPRAVIERK